MDLTLATLNTLSLHKVGNKTAGDGITFSGKPLEVSEPVRELLLRYFCSPFKPQGLFNLTHPSGLNLNEVYQFVSAIFNDPASLHEQSRHLAQHLYQNSTHPKIAVGEFYIAYLQNCIVNNETVDAVGLFKSESRETYLKVYPLNGAFEIGHDDGININKLDKGCLIFNHGKEEGYVCAIVDNLSKGSEAQYWRDEFLQVKPSADDFHHTSAVMNLCRKFVKEKLPQEFETSRADQADLLNRSMNFLKQNEDFEMDEFNEQVLNAPDLINSFTGFKNQLSGETEFNIPENFRISESAVKKQSKFMKSVIKLDKNFHIYIHGDRQMAEKGFDATRGLNYYQLYFREEQ